LRTRRRGHRGSVVPEESMDSLTVITNGMVLTCDDENRAGRFDVMIRNGRILEISAPQETPLRHPNAAIIDARGKLVLPGFVNAHFHTESLILRERTQFIPMALWNQDIRFREAKQLLQHPSNRDDARVLYLYAYFHHIRCGTTCVGEFLPEIDGKTLVGILQAIERTGVTPVVTLQTWDQLRLMRDLGRGRPRSCIGLGHEQDWTVHRFENLIRESTELGVPLAVHIAEQRDEVESVRKNFLKEPVELLHHFRMLQPQAAIVHGNHLTNTDCSILESLNAIVVVSPLSSAIKQTGYPALKHFLQRDIRFALATDWATTDMIDEMKFMYRLPLVVPGLRRFGAMEIVRMATINGAQSLNLDSEVGSLETGKRADITMLSCNRLGIPSVHGKDAEGVARILLAHLTSGDVSDMMTGGEFMMRDHTLMTIDENDLRESFHEIVQKIVPASKSTPQDTQEEFRKGRVFPLWHTRGSEIMSGLDMSGAEKLERPAEVSPEPVKEKENSPKTSKRVFGEDDLP